jgi:carbonic anhydrase
MNPYDKLVEGVKKFTQDVYPEYADLFRQLAKGQSPKTLFITCADSRLDPHLLTQSKPGEIFVCRSIGNLLPPHGSDDRGTAALIEFSVKVLGVEHLVVCGHSSCGAVKSLLDRTDDDAVPRVTAWLRYAESALQLTEALVKETASEPEKLRRGTELNVVAQLTNARTYPEIATAIALKKLTLHGWYYDFEHGSVSSYDAARDTFTTLAAPVA